MKKGSPSRKMYQLHYATGKNTCQTQLNGEKFRGFSPCLVGFEAEKYSKQACWSKATYLMASRKSKGQKELEREGTEKDASPRLSHSH